MSGGALFCCNIESSVLPAIGDQRKMALPETIDPAYRSGVRVFLEGALSKWIYFSLSQWLIFGVFS